MPNTTSFFSWSNPVVPGFLASIKWSHDTPSGLHPACLNSSGGIIASVRTAMCVLTAISNGSTVSDVPSEVIFLTPDPFIQSVFSLFPSSGLHISSSLHEWTPVWSSLYLFAFQSIFTFLQILPLARGISHSPALHVFHFVCQLCQVWQIRLCFLGLVCFRPICDARFCNHCWVLGLRYTLFVSFHIYRFISQTVWFRTVFICFVYKFSTFSKLVAGRIYLLCFFYLYLLFFPSTDQLDCFFFFCIK